MMSQNEPKNKWIDKLTKLYFGISIGGVILALCFLIYVLFQDDGFVFGLSLIVLCISVFVAYIDYRAIRQTQQGRTGLAIALVVLWGYTIFSTLMSNDNQWQSKLIFYVLDAIALFKVIVLIMNIQNKGQAKSHEVISDDYIVIYEEPQK